MTHQEWRTKKKERIPLRGKERWPEKPHAIGEKKIVCQLRAPVGTRKETTIENEKYYQGLDNYGNETGSWYKKSLLH